MNNQPGSNEEGYLAGANLHARIIQHCRIEPVLTPPLVKLVNSHATKIIAVSHGVEHKRVIINVQALAHRASVGQRLVDVDGIVDRGTQRWPDAMLK